MKVGKHKNWTAGPTFKGRANMNQVKVSIGLPVYNGADYLEAAIQSVLNQTFTDFELIISDNGSTDGTQEICEAFQAKDNRVKYYRQPENLGASKNFNFTVDAANASYFAWLSHDDYLAPEYIEKCFNILNEEPEVVLCFAQAVFVDENNDHLFVNNFKLRVNDADPEIRFSDMVASNHIVTEVFGLMRIDVLRKTPMLAAFMTADTVLLGELLLHGQFHQIQEPLFFHREHPDRSVKKCADPKLREQWFDSKKQVKRVYPLWRKLSEHAISTWRVPMSFISRARLLLFIFKVAYRRKNTLWQELTASS